jgi:hypothetical protein
MLFSVVRPRKERRRGIWARILDDFLGVILAEIEESKRDLQELLTRVIGKLAFYFILLVFAVSCFIFLNISAALWLRGLLLDDWAAYLAIGLFYAVLMLALFLGRLWKGSKKKSIGEGPGETATPDEALHPRRRRLNRDSPRILTKDWALPLAAVALGIGFLAAPGRKSSSPSPTAGRSRSFGLEVIVSFFANVANRIVDRTLDSYFAGRNRKSPGERR